MHRIPISVRFDFYILIAMSALILPVGWVGSWLVAAVVHEAAHICMMYILNVNILSITVCSRGAVINTGAMTTVKEVICALAGPVGGLICLLMIRMIPQISICAAVQSIYNLLPIYPLDGGRAVRCALTSLCGEKTADCISKLLTVIVSLLFLLCSVYLDIRFHIKLYLPVILLIIITLKKSLQSGENDSTILSNMERTSNR
jgi:Zn-dependent protease